MNNEQFESHLKTLKSSIRDPDVIDKFLEKRIIIEMNQRPLRFGGKRSAFRLAIIAMGCVVLLFVGVVVADNINVSTNKTDSAGNVVVQSESLWKYIRYHVHEHLRGLHDHLRRHFH